MKGNYFLMPLGAALFFVCSAFTIYRSIQNNDTPNDMSDCLKKYNYKWGQNCTQCYNSSKSYTAYFRNVCKETIDIKCAVQEKHKRWRTFLRNHLAPNDTLAAYACEGTGKYMYWVRKADDNSVTFPSDEEINSEYAR